LLVAALVAANLLTALALGLALRRLLIHRARRRQRNLFSRWPIATVPAGEIAPVLAAGPLGPGTESEIVAIANYRVPGGISDLETWILGNLAKTASLIFEFGTATGKTTYLLARNAPADARVVTLTLARSAAHLYREESTDDPDAKRAALAESLTEFTYAGTEAAAKITQLFGDSKDFDEGPYRGRCGLVFVDASHARSYVESDSCKALRMVRPGGTVFWHDYSGPRRTPGVFAALNALAHEMPLRHIAGTMLVVYRAGESQ
jgi:Methyltransferase domain